MFDLRAAMAALPVPDTQGLQPPHWEYWRNQLWHLAQTQPAESFLSWPCIYHTMANRHWPQVVQWELDTMLNSGKLPAGIEAPILRDPYAFTQEQNNIRQMYHLFKWEQVTGKKVADLESIVEIGGGYGACALMARRMGFKGRYMIFDLPEFSLLQQWYLDAAGVTGVEFITELPEKVAYPKRLVDLLIGIYSLSEMPIALRKIISTKLTAKSYLFLYSGNWVNHDNRKYFQNDFSGVHDTLQWHHEEAIHHIDRNNFYSIGW